MDLDEIKETFQIENSELVNNVTAKQFRIQHYGKMSQMHYRKQNRTHLDRKTVLENHQKGQRERFVAFLQSSRSSR